MYRTYFLHTQQATTAHENWKTRGYQVIPFLHDRKTLFFWNLYGVPINGWLLQSTNHPSCPKRRFRRRFRTVLAFPPSRRSVVPRSYRAVAKGGWYTGKLAAKLKKDISWKIYGKIIEIMCFFLGGCAEFVDFFGRRWTWSLIILVIISRIERKM